jgi:hypothetical protein
MGTEPALVGIKKTGKKEIAASNTPAKENYSPLIRIIGFDTMQGKEYSLELDHLALASLSEGNSDLLEPESALDLA